MAISILARIIKKKAIVTKNYFRPARTRATKLTSTKVL